MKKEPLYKKNVSIIKVFGYGDEKKIKIVTMNSLRTSGLELDDTVFRDKCSVNESKLDDNIQRAKSKIFEYAFCNPWDWFFTATLDPKKYDRTDLDCFHKDLTQFFRNYGRRNDCKISFLLIPELHADGRSWHMHGLLHGLPAEYLHRFELGDKMGAKLAQKVKAGDEIYNWIPYLRKFGFCDLEPIKNHEAVSKYITKYINKHLSESVTDLGAHLYYHSRGLRLAETVKKGFMAYSTINPDFVNDYCSVSWIDYSDDVLEYLIESIQE